MVLRLIFRWLANNEQLVSRLADSYPIRRAAQMVVYLFNRSKSITQDPAVTSKLDGLNVSEKLKRVRDYLEKKTKDQ